ncbi:MAG: hypothetical protein OXI67_02480 [Candidatus Poribacteria bacterium]|nr:hypothetical protein [Candidatus Poribacteria bacterium]
MLTRCAYYAKPPTCLMLCQRIVGGRDSEIAPTDEPLMVGGNSDSRLLQDHQLALD